jgi:hypothetical protein
MAPKPRNHGRDKPISRAQRSASFPRSRCRHPAALWPNPAVIGFPIVPPPSRHHSPPLLQSSCNELGHLCAPSAATKLMGRAMIRAHRRHSASLRRRYRLVTLIYAAHGHHHPAGSSDATPSFVAHARCYLASAMRGPRASAVFGCRSLASKQWR